MCIYIYISVKFIVLYMCFTVLNNMSGLFALFCHSAKQMNQSGPKTGLIFFMKKFLQHHIPAVSCRLCPGLVCCGPVSGSGGFDSPHSRQFSLAGLCGDQGSLPRHDGKVPEDFSSAERPAVPLHTVDRARHGK